MGAGRQYSQTKNWQTRTKLTQCLAQILKITFERLARGDGGGEWIITVDAHIALCLNHVPREHDIEVQSWDVTGELTSHFPDWTFFDECRTLSMIPSAFFFFFLSLKLTSEGKRCCERGCGRKWWAILWQRYRGISMSSRNTDETDFLKNTNAISQHHLSAAFTNAATARPPPRYAFWLLEHRRSQMARGTQRQLHFPPTRDNMMTITAHSPDTMDDVTTALGSRKITKPLENT